MYINKMTFLGGLKRDGSTDLALILKYLKEGCIQFGYKFYFSLDSCGLA